MAGFRPVNRLRRPRDFKRVFARASRLRSASFTVLSRSRAAAQLRSEGANLASSDAGQARLGLAVAKKRLKRAVDRNRAKRLIREAFRCRIADLPAVDLVVLVNAPLKETSNQQLLAELDGLLMRLVDRGAD